MKNLSANQFTEIPLGFQRWDLPQDDALVYQPPELLECQPPMESDRQVKTLSNDQDSIRQSGKLLVPTCLQQGLNGEHHEFLASVFGWSLAPPEGQSCNAPFALTILQQRGIENRGMLENYYREVFDNLGDDESCEVLKLWMSVYSGGVNLFMQEPRWWPTGYQYWSPEDLTAKRKLPLFHSSLEDYLRCFRQK
ncbi:hypothetical protein N7540_013057 [Penicillium herquei]|nr:hypothetical protein N7540_013057 [Penicillium herquei]